jgi:hypothetical protein
LSDLLDLFEVLTGGLDVLLECVSGIFDVTLAQYEFRARNACPMFKACQEASGPFARMRAQISRDLHTSLQKDSIGKSVGMLNFRSPHNFGFLFVRQKAVSRRAARLDKSCSSSERDRIVLSLAIGARLLELCSSLAQA